MSTDLDPRDADLRSRFTTASSGLDVDAGEVADVRSRGRRRARTQRALVAGGVVGAVALAAVAVGSVMPTAAPTIDPVGEGTESGTVAPSDPIASDPRQPGDPTTAPESEPPAEPEGSASEIPVADLSRHEWTYTRFSASSLTVTDGTTTGEPDGEFGGDDRITRVMAASDGRVVYQSLGPENEPFELGALQILDDGDLYSAGSFGRSQRLVGVGEERLWFTFREGPAGVEGEDVEKLAWMSLDGSPGREPTVVGTSAMVESATDEIVFLSRADEGPVAFLGCHLQCGLRLAESVDAWMAGDVDGELLSGWLYGLDASPDGGLLATVVGPDPNIADDDVTLTLLEVTGEVHAEIPLPSGISWGAGRVEFSPDARQIAVTDLDGGWLVSDWQTGTPTLERLTDGLTWHGDPRPVD